MMLRSLADFVEHSRATKSDRTNMADTVGLLGNDENPYIYAKGVTTDMLLDAVLRLTANDFDCHTFMQGDHPTYCRFTKNAKGKIVSIVLNYRKS